MNHHNGFLCVYMFFYLFFLQDTVILYAHSVDHQVIFSLKQFPKGKQRHRSYNHRIHQATYEIKKQCKLHYKNSIDENHYYPHRRDTVFFIHFDHKFNSWTLYKPSFIPYDAFIELAKKIYAHYGLQVTCNLDQSVTLTHGDMTLGNNDSLTLEEFETYKKMPDEEFVSKINDLKNKISNDSKDKIKHLEKIQNMKKFFFWHLQIPTTGLLAGKNFDIEDQYKPLAWHFLLWDLAPKKGEGAHVAIIDTGISAFKLHDKEFADTYKKNINITMPDVLQNYGYNLVSENGLDPIRQIAINFGHYCDQEKFDSDELMQKLPAWIIDFIKNKNKIQLEQYFIKTAKKEYLDKGKLKLNEKGEELFKDLLYGKYGITPSGKDSFFHIVQLDHPYNEEVLLETLPAPKIANDGFSAGHGTFTQGVVNAKLNQDRGIFGLAPQAHVTMIKAFKDSGTTSKTTLNAALQRAIALKNSIVSMSLKITDEIDKVTDAPLKELINSIDYVVAASGNDGTSLSKEAYPAKFDSVAFDVGAFQYDAGKYSVCSFTQKELEIGPKFVAPGFNLFSSGLTPDQTADSMYLFMMGTSIAVPVITGFLALVLAEFQDVFTREQILKVIYKFSIKLNNDDTWQKYIKLGTPDMRSSLLCLHVLQSLRQTLKNDNQYLFDSHFDNLVQAIYTVNYYVPSWYEKQIGISLMNNFSSYNHVLQEKSPAINVDFFIPTSNNVSSCVNFISQLILHAINSKKYPAKVNDANKELCLSLQKIVTTKKFDLFAQLSSAAQNRIKGVLKPKHTCMLD